MNSDSDKVAVIIADDGRTPMLVQACDSLAEADDLIEYDERFHTALIDPRVYARYQRLIDLA